MMKDKWLRERHKKQKDNTEKRCANQRSALASLNIKISNQQAEIDRLKEALEFYAKEEHLKIDTRGNMKNKEDWEICGEADNYWNNGDKKYFYCEDGYKARKALNSKARENVN